MHLKTLEKPEANLKPGKLQEMLKKREGKNSIQNQTKY